MKVSKVEIMYTLDGVPEIMEIPNVIIPVVGDIVTIQTMSFKITKRAIAFHHACIVVLKADIV